MKAFFIRKNQKVRHPIYPLFSVNSNQKVRIVKLDSGFDAYYCNLYILDLRVAYMSKMVSQPEESDMKFVKHEMISYTIDPSDPEYVKKLWVGDRYEITFYPSYNIPLQVYDRNSGVIYQLKTTPKVDYVGPWFSEVEELEKSLKEQGEEETVEWILRTLKDYFSIGD